MIKHTLKYIEESIPKEVEEKILEEVSRRCNVDPLFEDEKWSDRVRIVYEEIFGKDEDAHDVWFEMGEMNREADKTESEGQMTIEEQITIFEHNAEHERKEGDLNNCLHFRQLAEWLKDYKRLLEQKPNIKALGEDIRICQKSITDKKVLIGFNMAVALCNKYLAESEEV